MSSKCLKKSEIMPFGKEFEVGQRTYSCFPGVSDTSTTQQHAFTRHWLLSLLLIVETTIIGDRALVRHVLLGLSR